MSEVNVTVNSERTGLLVPKELLESILYVKRSMDPAELGRTNKSYDHALTVLRAAFEKEWGYPE